MIPDAFTHDEQPIYAGDYTTHEWDRLKGQSLENPFAFKIGCCSSRAVLKTSINSLQFFAHYSDECATAPESKWHIAGKDMIVDALNLYGVNPRLKVSGGTGKDRWKADVYFEVGDRKIAIELQRSYQHLRDFVRRQEWYERYGVECYWLVRDEVAKPLGKSILRKRWNEEFNRTMPHDSFFVNLPTFFFSILNPEADVHVNVHSPRLSTSHFELLAAIFNNDLRWNGKHWSITPDAAV